VGCVLRDLKAHSKENLGIQRRAFKKATGKQSRLGYTCVCVGDTRVPCVSALDIGGAAFTGTDLTQSEPPNTHYRICGPESITLLHA
jgi:hypothetical protein